MKRFGVITAAIATAAAATVALAPGAQARPAPHWNSHSSHSTSSSLGTTTVTTGRGIAATLLRAGIAPLPLLPRTGFGVSLRHGLQVSYAFPITSSTANLGTASGDILHAGGIVFASRKASLEIG
ncbi:MAG: hypothetical protein ABI345_09330, partial [Jatrophihabitans sp.]